MTDTQKPEALRLAEALEHFSSVDYDELALPAAIELRRLQAENEALRAVVEAYEKNGVTCQTFRHFVDSPCAECNVTAMKEKP